MTGGGGDSPFTRSNLKKPSHKKEKDCMGRNQRITKKVPIGIKPQRGTSRITLYWERRGGCRQEAQKPVRTKKRGRGEHGEKGRNRKGGGKVGGRREKAGVAEKCLQQRSGFTGTSNQTQGGGV